ncbi:hypothetical protein M758_5G104100 [Ceratodon purpureus]|nr:hypothetical protein M758_5G104100 [Ceratodon purpureus]KAG0616290.1 hypothetical protein M758_5G104100 [Ceratodon purpureus]KAG0616291.1 hypothetical protein M758_5G104100 [Ceratodon purpureus]KAG0616292.1 hypothetical protein M758_5G104100 [Ceratodon purpureus]KAG0616293.1 hypothetical protein M758_5G104100 [Ceratodon purpureus]
MEAMYISHAHQMVKAGPDFCIRHLLDRGRLLITGYFLFAHAGASHIHPNALLSLSSVGFSRVQWVGGVKYLVRISVPYSPSGYETRSRQFCAISIWNSALDIRATD